MLTAAVIFLCCLLSSHIGSEVSGQEITSKVMDVYQQMRANNYADESERIRFVVVEVKGGYFGIQKIYRQKDLEGKDVYQFFLSLLEPHHCLYLLYDCHFTRAIISSTQALFLVTWIPDLAPIREKLLYGKGREKLPLLHVSYSLNMNDASLYNNRKVFAKYLGKYIISLEGVPLIENGSN